MFFECTYYQCHLKNFPSPRLWIRRCLFMPMWLVNLGRYFELPEQMPCNTPACHDDMSHIRIGTLSTASPLQMLLSNNKQVVPENAVQTCQGAAWGARRWEEHDARRRFFFQSVFEPGGQEGLTTSTATRLLQVASSIHMYGQFGIPPGQRRRLPPAARPPSSGAIDGPCPSRTRGKHTSARTSDKITALWPA